MVPRLRVGNDGTNARGASTIADTATGTGLVSVDVHVHGAVVLLFKIESSNY